MDEKAHEKLIAEIDARLAAARQAMIEQMNAMLFPEGRDKVADDLDKMIHDLTFRR